MTCESVSDVTTRNINRHSYVPVVHDGGFGGLFFAERFFDATPPSGKISERVSAPEETLVGADASISRLHPRRRPKAVSARAVLVKANLMQEGIAHPGVRRA